MHNTHQPIAIVGMACRFPGESDNPEKFWDLLINQKDAMVPVPQARWNTNRFCSDNPATKGKMYNKLGAFLNQSITEFDPGLFSIPPREAECLDPQQRLLLEVSWEAMENAGFNVQRLAGENVGVFVGGFTLDHLINQMSSQSRDHIGAHTAVGSTLTVLSNRISHTFDFRGPSISMDTACSSSLVAFHQACLAIKNGDCHTSLVGGVNVMMRPEYPITMCKGGFLAKDSHCKSFDESADGYARGEGAGVVVIKALDQAIADNDPIIAVVNASGVNQDGRTHGITVPNPDSQKDLITRVCNEGAIDPSKVAYVEAHGTGTPVGDPIEADAIGSIYGANRSSDNPVVIGSLKSNVGHLEAAAGIAGVIKAVLCLQKNEVPALATLNHPNPNIPFKKLGLELARERKTLTDTPDECSIGINSFGYGGTNAHAVVSAPKPYVPVQEYIDSQINRDLIPFSANDQAALSASLSEYLALIENASDSEYLQIIRSLQSRRTPLKERVCLISDSKEKTCQTLRAILNGEVPENIRQGHTIDEKNKGPVFVYTGMGPQWWGMGQALYEAEPVFRKTVDEIDVLFHEVAGYSILEEMMKDEESSNMANTLISQPANFALQIGLTELLKSQGVKPSAVIGHSLGEISSAYVAGTVSLKDAVNIIYYRSMIIKQIAGAGGMLAVAISQEVGESLIEDPEKLSIAAVNSPNMITFAGEEDVLENLEQAFTEEGIFCRMLKVEVPFHSPMVAPLKDQVYDALDNIVAHKPHTDIYSTVEGKLANDVDFDVHYWYRNMRQPVLFDGAVKDIIDDGYKTFLEVGPHPVLSASLKECFKVYKSNAVTLPTLKRGEPELEQSRLCLADLQVVCNAIDWKAVNGSVPYYPLPNYPWQREELWSEPEAARIDRAGQVDTPYLGMETTSAKPEWTLQVNGNYIPYIQDHRIDDLAVLPGAAYLESFSQLYKKLFDRNAHLTNVQFHSPIVFDENDWPNVEISYNEDTNSAEIHQISASGTPKLVAKASFLDPVDHVFSDPNKLKELETRFDGVEADSNEAFYALTDAIGLGYHNDYRSLDNVKANDLEVFAKVNIKNEEQAKQHSVYPPALDACFQSLLSALIKEQKVSGPVVPVSVGSLKVLSPLTGSVKVHSKLVREDDNAFVCDLQIFNESGSLVVDIKQLTCEPVNRTSKYLSVEHINKRVCEYSYHVVEDLNQEEARTTAIAHKCIVLSADQLVIDQCNGLANVTPFLLPTQLPGSGVENIAQDISNLVKDDVKQIVYIPGCGLDAHNPASIRPQMMNIAELLKQLTDKNLNLTLVSQHAHKIHDEDLIDPSQTAFLSFFRVVANESDHLRTRAIDVLSYTQENIQLAINLGAQKSAYDELVCREGILYEPKLARSKALTGRETLPLANDDVFTLRYQEFLGRDALTKHELHSASSENVCKLRSMKTVGGLLLGSGFRIETSDQGIAISSGKLSNSIDLSSEDTLWLSHKGKLSHEAYTASVFPYALADLTLQQVGKPKENQAVVLAADQLGYCFAELLKDSGADIYLVQEPGKATYKAGECAFANYIALDELASLGGSAHLMVGPVQQWLGKAFLGRICENSIVVDSTDLLDSSNEESVNKVALSLLAKASQVIKPQGSLLLNNFKGIFTEALVRTIYRLDAGIAEPLAYTELSPVQWSEQQTSESLVSLSDGHTHTAEYSDQTSITSDKTYIITGGFGGFGKRVALWLIEQGANQIALVGRSGAKTQDDEEFVSLLKELGIQIHVEKCDVAQAEQVDGLVQSLLRRGSAIGGVFHCAGVLDDKPITELDAQSVDNVLNAKAQGAYNLHKSTKDHGLDLFVLFSSIASDVGNSMQASYVTANGYLDGLVHARRASGLPAISINWGAIDDAGMVAESELVRKHFAQMGVYPVPVDEAIKVMGECIKRNVARLAYGDIDWNKWGRVEKVGGKSAKFTELVDQQSGSEGNDIASELLLLDTEERIDVLATLLAEILSVELNTAADQIERGIPMVELGVDSLLATSLQLSIEDKFNVAVSVIELAGDGTVENLAEKILDRIEL